VCRGIIILCICERLRDKPPNTNREDAGGLVLKAGLCLCGGQFISIVNSSYGPMGPVEQ
jgi:hypothetical protein